MAIYSLDNSIYKRGSKSRGGENGRKRNRRENWSFHWMFPIVSLHGFYSKTAF